VYEPLPPPTDLEPPAGPMTVPLPREETPPPP
jgi:hypothetical protein